MSEFANILVPTDLSPHSNEAIAIASKLAKPFDSKIHLLLVYHTEGSRFPTDTVSIPNDFWGTTPDGVEKIVEETASQLITESGLTVVTHVKDGNPELVICDLARDIPADLIVMGSRGRRGLQHVLMGSVAERTIRMAPCPVLVTKAVIADREFESHSVEELPRRR